jgi:hypothetical protein
MLRFFSALVLTLAWAAGLTYVMLPGLSNLGAGLESGKRIALAQYQQQMSPEQ